MKSPPSNYSSSSSPRRPSFTILWQAVRALELAEGSKEVALDLLLAGAILPAEGEADIVGQASSRATTPRLNSGNLNKQLRTLENLHPGRGTRPTPPPLIHAPPKQQPRFPPHSLSPEYRRSRKWQLSARTPGGSATRKLEWTRIPTGTHSSEASESDVYATRVEIQGWLRSFRTDGSGSLEFVTTAEGASFRDAASITDAQLESLVEARELSFPEKTAWFRRQITQSGLCDSWDNRFEMTLRRESMWEDSFSQLAGLPGDHWRRPFNLHFDGELGHDAGGLTREWFSIILRKVRAVRAHLPPVVVS